MAKLVHVDVKGLLGLFNYSIDIPENVEFIILHGPNGSGKTKLLELIHSALQFRSSLLAGIPFASALLIFSNGQRLSVERIEAVESPMADDSHSSTKVAYTLAGTDKDKPIRWVYHLESQTDARFISHLIERELPVRRVVSSRGVRYRDLRIGDLLSTLEVAERYFDILPASLREMAFSSGQESMPRDFPRFAEKTPVHLIETQRLLNFSSRDAGRKGDESEFRSTVSEFAQALVQRLRDAHSQHSQVTQQLDRQFPRRLMTDSAIQDDVTDDRIRQRYAQQSDLRNSLAENSILDTSVDLPLPSRDLEPWERRVLWTYLDDTDQKLATFEPLLERVSLLREIVNRRFSYKKLVIDRDRGFRFITDSGVELGPEKLSSGEQHELILIYDLLFNVQRNALVLIDEPEISLHVAWQQEFLNDIVRIADVASLRFIVATHSPQIVNRWRSREIPLGHRASANH